VASANYSSNRERYPHSPAARSPWFDGNNLRGEACSLVTRFMEKEPAANK
jgi:hypothetical protein